MKKPQFLFTVVLFISALLLFSYIKFIYQIDKAYHWDRVENTFVNRHYGLEITKTKKWFRYKGHAAAPISKKNLIEFHRLGIREKPDAVVAIGAVDDLSKQPFRRSVYEYAKQSMEAIMGKYWLKEGTIKMIQFKGRSCAKAQILSEVKKSIDFKTEDYYFIVENKGYSFTYAALPSEFDKYYDEGMKIIESIQFLQSEDKGE